MFLRLRQSAVIDNSDDYASPMGDGGKSRMGEGRKRGKEGT